MRSSAFLLATLAALAVVSGCKSNSNGSSGSSGSTGTSATTGTTASTGTTSGSTGSTGDAGPTPCTTDLQCAAPQVCNAQPGGSGFCDAPCLYDDLCPSGLRCDEVSGHCITAKPCDDSVVASPVDACNDSVEDGGYCNDLGSRCRCTTPDAGRGAGVCRRVRETCAPCDDSSECNPCPEGSGDCDPSNYVFPSQCAQVGDAGEFCLRTASSQGCPFGYVGDPATSTCQPPTGTCVNFAPCGSDNDCLQSKGPGYYCDANNGVCQQFCTFDYLQGTSTNCPPGDVCNVIPADVLPDAGLARYGVGTCGLPCNAAGGADCTALGAQDGLQYACVQERSGEHRCRPVSSPDGGGCMDDVECPRTTDGGVYAGYCAIYQFSCQYDCRDGTNPLTGKPYGDHDCQPPSGVATSYKCVDNACIEKNCVERGGASHGATDQLCCGEDRDHSGYNPDSGFADFTHQANVCPGGVDAGEFYLAPAPPFCKTGCQTGNTNLDDGGVEILDFATCSADMGIPNFDALGSPNICIPYAQDASGNPINDCVISAQYATECPRNWQFGGVQRGCGQDSDCDENFPDGGTSTLGHCNIYPDGGGPQTCGCTQDEIVDGGYLWGGQCPDFTRCETHKDCIYTRGCIPSVLVCQAAP